MCVAAHLWSESNVIVLNKARVGVVFDVLALDVVFQMKERFTRSVSHLQHTHLHDVHLRTIHRRHTDINEANGGVCTDLIRTLERHSPVRTSTLCCCTCFGGLCLLYSSPQSLASICSLTSSK